MLTQTARVRARMENDQGEQDEDDRFEFRAQIFCENASGSRVSTWAFSPDSRKVLIPTTEREIAVWDCITDEVAKVINCQVQAKQALYVHKTVIVDSNVGWGFLGPGAGKRSLAYAKGKRYTSLHVVMDGTKLCAVSLTDGEVRLVELTVGELEEQGMTMQLAEDLLPFDEGTELFATSNGKHVCLGLQYSNTLAVLDLDTKLATQFVLEEHVVDCGEDVFVSCMINATHVGLVTDFGRLLVFKLAQPNKPWINTLASCAQFSPNGRLMFLANREVMQMWSVAARAESHSLQRPQLLKNRDCTLAVFSPNGRTVAASCDAAIYLWETEFGHYLGALCDAEQTIMDMCFSYNSNRLLALCRDEEEGMDRLKCTQIVWDLQSGPRERMRILGCHPELHGLPNLLRRIQSFLFSD
ncbi:hypothetical protein BASA81_011313 [Batrachochytrium salamandrivorans]|nr:hypothetical protein BASA81_011313 [Batrachochytrium salamandrivorans]